MVITTTKLFFKTRFIYFNDCVAGIMAIDTLLIVKDFSMIKLSQGILRLVPRRARCTNVIRLGHLALHSGVVSGI